VDVHRSRVPCEGVPPHALQELISREHDPAVIEQLPEQIELLRRETDLLVTDVDLALAGVDREISVPKLLRLALAALGRSTA
jgi:hypothetical protein